MNEVLTPSREELSWSPPPKASILLEDQAGKSGSLYFANAIEWVIARRADEVSGAFDRLRRAQNDGLWAAGFLSYELGYILEPKLSALLPSNRSAPLLLFGLFEQPQTAPEKNQLDQRTRQSDIGPLQMAAAMLESQFRSDFLTIKEYIARGDTYQINHTFPLRFSSTADPKALYEMLRRRSRGTYGAYMDLGDHKILSCSPELFLRRQGARLISRPMKGTAPRGRNEQEDEQARQWLANDPKSKAENLMILDLIRNDLGRVAQTGSVTVDAQFDIERYPTLHQMTSTVSATLKANTNFEDIIQALFPCGSITGAPKIRSMEIIRELEMEPRGVYTGSIGHIAPNGDFLFNVAIRTVVLDRHGRGELGIGSGIVWDSELQSEFDETHLKSTFLTNPMERFDLFETMQWSKAGGFLRLELHLERLASSARYFGFPCDLEEIRRNLTVSAADFQNTVHRVRLTLNDLGNADIEVFPFEPVPDGTVYKVVVSPCRVDSNNPLLFHKSTQRKLYDGEHQRLSMKHGVDEVLFMNEKNQLVEGSRTNVFLKRNGILYTPAIECGLLPGCLRRSLLDDPTVKVKEAILESDDLREADEIFVGNSLRGLVRAELIHSVDK